MPRKINSRHLNRYLSERWSDSERQRSLNRLKGFPSRSSGLWNVRPLEGKLSPSNGIFRVALLSSHYSFHDMLCWYMDSMVQDSACISGTLFSPPGSYRSTKQAAGGTECGAADDLRWLSVSFNVIVVAVDHSKEKQGLLECWIQFENPGWWKEEVT